MKLEAVLNRNVLIFAPDAEALQDALAAVAESLRQEGGRLIYVPPGTELAAPAGVMVRTASAPLSGAEAVEAISILLRELNPVCVLLAGIHGASEQLAGAVWESMRRTGLRTLIIGELNQPLPLLTGWIPGPDDMPPATTPLRNALRQYRMTEAGASRPGNAYWQVDALDTTFPGHYRPALALRENPYRIDVIVRTAGRDTLGRAIESVLTQNWPDIGLIVVNVGPRPLQDWFAGLELPTHVSLQLIDAPGARRAAAGNIGLKATRGEAFVFLDDDDQLYASHFSVLSRELDSHPGAMVAYGGVRVEHQDRNGQCVDLDLLNEPFDQERLYLENYIPIHACLVRRRLLDVGIAFDEELDHFEDWDFWLKCAEQGGFRHTPEVVAIYYVGDASGVAGAGVRSIHERWLARRGAEPLERIARWALSQNTPAARTRQRQLDALRARESALLTELDLARQQCAQAEAARAQAEQPVQHQAEEVAPQSSQQPDIRHELEQRLAHAEAQRARLEGEIAMLRSSTSWRLMAPARTAITVARCLPALPRKLSRQVQEHGGGGLGLRHMGTRFARAVQRQGLLSTLRRIIHMLTNPPAENSIMPPTVIPDGRTPRAPVTPHRQQTDIVICIHNALEDVQRCIASVQAHTTGPYHLILVDDGSAAPTRDYLAENFGHAEGITLVRHEQAGGYTKAANAGMRAGKSPFIVLLNSDTIVGPEWLDRLMACLLSDAQIALVGPLSNCASWQSVPEIESRTGGDWAENPLPEGWTTEQMARQIAADSLRIYPRLGFINGFCQLLRRAATDVVGLLDEQAFPQGYGEENDLCLRLRKAGWSLAVADDVWVYHAQSKSYSNERRKRLCDAAALALAGKHGQAAIDQGVRLCRDDLALLGIRHRVAHMAERQSCIAAARRAHQGRRILFLLPSTDAGGGANVIMTEAAAMRRMGVDAVILNLKANENQFSRNYGDYPVPVIYVSHPNEIPALGATFDAVVASIYYTVDWLAPLCNGAGTPLCAYYVQDFEPYFFAEGTPGRQEALASYSALPSMVRFCKTRWNRDTVKEHTGQDCHLIGPSFDIDLFRPTQRQAHDKVRICAMIRPNSPYRSPALTMQILGDIWHARPAQVEITTFGVDATDPAFLALRSDFAFTHLGKLNSAQIASVLDQTDVFADFSTYQAMGLTALEAMASHTAVLMPAKGGVGDIAENGVNALFVDAVDPEACRATLLRLIDEPELRQRLATAALESAQQHYPEKAARRILDALFSAPQPS